MVRMTKAAKAELARVALAKADDAHARLPALVFAEGMSREATLTCLADAYGDAPSREREEAVGLTYKAARMAAAIPSNRSMEDRIADCRLLITKYASPDVASIRDDQMGKRTTEQEKAYRAASQWLSKARADIGIGQAATTKAKNSKQAAKSAGKRDDSNGRAPHHNNGGPNADKGADNPPIKPEASPEKWTSERFEKHAEMQMASLLACLNRAQKDTKGGINLALGSAITDAKAAIDKAIADARKPKA